MPGGIRPAAGPVDDKRLAGMIQPVVAAAGLDLESVRVTTAGKRRLLRVVVDGDHSVSLDETAYVSREVSVLLDASNAMGEVPYTLEVSSPGVDRPLTESRHWRRAARRLVRVKIAGEGTVQGRVLVADEAGVTLDLGDGARRAFTYDLLGPGTVQVEFGRLPEIDDAGDLPADDELNDELDDDELDDDGLDEPEDEDLNDEDLNNDEADLGGGGDGH